jgi:tol-pal system protein YbgF
VLAQGALTPEQLTLEVERLSELSQRTDARLSSALEQLKKLSEDMSRLGRMIENSAKMGMNQQIDDIAEAVSLLRGEIEVQGNDINGIKKRQRELYLDLDRRLRDIESGATATSEFGSATTPSSAASVAQTPSATQREEKAAYQAAFDKLKEGRYKDAISELRKFLAQHPSSSLAGNAQYWLGEAHYVTRDFELGIVEFEKVFNKYPNSKKVPDAMLRLGYTYYELEQFSQAKTILQYLRTIFPDSNAAQLAGKRLDRIRKEGH